MSTTNNIPTLELVSAEEWLRVNAAEYLKDFIADGGSAVRFVSGSASELSAVHKALQDDCSSQNFHYVHYDPSLFAENGKKPDFHYIERFFFEISRSIDWSALAGKQILSELRKQGVRFPEDRLTTDHYCVGRFNDIEPDRIMSIYEKLVTNVSLRDLGMAVELRIAVAALARSHILPDEMSPTMQELLLGWLTGEKAVPGGHQALKRLRIYERINRTNARVMFSSMLHWLRNTGATGLIATFDFRPYEYSGAAASHKAKYNLDSLRLAIESGATTGELLSLIKEPATQKPQIAYTTKAYISALELLRHFIDDIENVEGFLLVVLGTPEFFSDRPKASSKERRFGDYDALQTRIGLEVRDAARQNLSASLMHLLSDQ